MGATARAVEMPRLTAPPTTKLLGLAATLTPAESSWDRLRDDEGMPWSAAVFPPDLHTHSMGWGIDE